jgi:hypothetical protein
VTTLELGGMTLGLREGLIGLIGLVAFYILFVLLRMLHLRKPAASVPATGNGEAPAARDEAAEMAPALPAGEAESALPATGRPSRPAWRTRCCAAGWSRNGAVA